MTEVLLTVRGLSDSFVRVLSVNTQMFMQRQQPLFFELPSVITMILVLMLNSSSWCAWPCTGCLHSAVRTEYLENCRGYQGCGVGVRVRRNFGGVRVGKYVPTLIDVDIKSEIDTSYSNH
jgi:hypothetical protein